MRVLLVTSTNLHCGIREYGEMLTEAMQETHPDVELRPVGPDAPAALDFVDSLADTSVEFDLVHINHQAALHSSWTVEHVSELRRRFCPVVVTHHDTFERADILLERGYSFFIGLADHIVVHEPVEGLPFDGPWTYLRQPVPAKEKPLAQPSLTVGSVGFDFPWKNFAKLEELAERAGWQTDIFGGNLDWVSRKEAVARLAGCHVTAFLYQTGNSGTSAAIRLGLAARRPVIAYPCRQFRDLAGDPETHGAVQWVSSEAEFLDKLDRLSHDEGFQRSATDRVKHLADRDSWTNGAEVYYQIYKRVLQEVKRYDRPNR